MPNNNNPLLSRLSAEELLVSPERQEWFTGCMRAVHGSAKFEELMAEKMGENDDDFWPEPDDWRAEYRPYVVSNGVLQIPVQGVLLNRLPYSIGRYATGYAYIQRAVQRGMADPNVRGIALIIDSPGGEVAGNFELVDKIYAARGTKPIRAFAAEHAYSAAYSIASSADSIVMTRLGGVGSIGVVTAHVDLSGALDKAGVKVTFIYAGKHKVDGNPYESLPDDVKSRIQQRIDRIYGIFVATVARNRGISDESVRKTEAATFSAEEALEIGLADSVGVFEETLAAFAEEVGEHHTGEFTMADKNEAAVTTVTQAAHEAAVASARAEGVTAGTAEGRKSERERLTAIVGLDSAKTRQATALKMALTTDMSVEQIDNLLVDLPETQATAPVQKKEEQKRDHFSEAMEKSGNPDVGAATKEQNDEATQLASIVGDYRSVTGQPARKSA